MRARAHGCAGPRTVRLTPPGERSLQGYSRAEWIRGGGGGFFGGGFAGFGGGGGGTKRWAPLKVVTEYFLRLSDDEDEWLTISTTVEDPKYLLGSLITSSNFKKEPDGSRWKPVPCKAL